MFSNILKSFLSTWKKQMNLELERSFSAWMFRILLGPSIIIEGIVATFTLGTVSTGLHLFVARKLARARLDANMLNYFKASAAIGDDL